MICLQVWDCLPEKRFKVLLIGICLLRILFCKYFLCQLNYFIFFILHTICFHNGSVFSNSNVRLKTCLLLAFWNSKYNSKVKEYSVVDLHICIGKFGFIECFFKYEDTIQI